jgi:hypothetical protein
MVTLKASRPMLIAGSVVCGAMIVVLSFVAVLYWRYPDFRDEVFPVILFFDLVFAYRLYRYINLMPRKKTAS